MDLVFVYTKVDSLLFSFCHCTGQNAFPPQSLFTLRFFPRNSLNNHAITTPLFKGLELLARFVAYIYDRWNILSFLQDKTRIAKKHSCKRTKLKLTECCYWMLKKTITVANHRIVCLQKSFPCLWPKLL